MNGPSVDSRGATGENSEGNEKHVLKTGGILVIMKESLAKLYPIVMQKAKHVRNELRKFPNRVLKVWTGFFSLFILKCKKREVNQREEMFNQKTPQDLMF